MLELTPLFLGRIRARLDAKALEAELGPIAIPIEPLDTCARPNSMGLRAEVVVITR